MRYSSVPPFGRAAVSPLARRHHDDVLGDGLAVGHFDLARGLVAQRHHDLLDGAHGTLPLQILAVALALEEVAKEAHAAVVALRRAHCDVLMREAARVH